MLARTSEMLILGCHLITGFPSGPTRNFSKFHLMSLIFRGSQNSLFEGLPKLSPTGGQEFLRKVKTFCSSFPFTSPFSNSGKFGTNPLPGLTCFNPGRISCACPGSCFPNWLQGKPRMVSPKGFISSCSAFRSTYCKVYPQYVATLMKRTLLPA